MSNTIHSALTPVVIIAGGNAVRLNNTIKCMITIGQTTLLERLVKNIRAQQKQTYDQTGKIYLNINHVDKKIINLCDNLNIQIIKDLPAFAHQGPLAGVVSALRVINTREYHQEHNKEHNQEQAGIITISGDSIGLAPHFYDNLHAQKTAPNSLTYCISDQSQAFLHAYWPTKSIKLIECFLESNQRAIGQFLKKHHAQTHHFSQQRLPNNQTFDPFYNINTPQDLNMATKMLTPNGISKH